MSSTVKATETEQKKLYDMTRIIPLIQNYLLHLSKEDLR